MPRNALNTRLEAHAPQPLYKQVEKQILDCLARGEWKPGDRIPTEPQLAERFGVAVFTIRAGIAELAAAGILVRRQGKGTFVARHDRQRLRYQFSHVFDDRGEKISPERRLLSFRRTAADDDTAARLRLDRRDRMVFHLACALELGQRAVAAMDIVVPCHLFRGLTARAIRASDENLYAVYQQVCGVNVIRIEEQVYAVKAGAVGRTLGIAAADPVLRVDRMAYTYNDVPVEFRRRHYEASRHHYRLDEGGV
jgi:GntR family transcriptional regulator